jgi:hypothetical protein
MSVINRIEAKTRRSIIVVDGARAAKTIYLSWQ